MIIVERRWLTNMQFVHTGSPIIRFDPIRSLLDDNFPIPSFQKGLKIHETDNSIVVEAVCNWST